jgi:DNA-binding GntR family transcriptional regulator
MGLSDSEIWTWQTDPAAAKRIAARLALDIRKGSLAKWGELPANATLADEFDTSLRTVCRAKKLLADLGFIQAVGGRYYVA